MHIFFYILFAIVLFLVELLYFHLASANKIIDRPNERSSHTIVTIRGGGIIFPIAAICWAILNHFQFPFFISGLFLISFISLLDDIKNLHSRTRSFFHFLSVSLMLYQLPLSTNWYWYIPVFIVIVGFINAYNFMDGINGITGGYSLITLGSLWYVNHFINPFISESFIVFLILSLIVFNFFNFRPKAKCFAGDVGSVSIAFIISFLLIQAIFHANNFIFIGFVLVYGLDAVSTILFRLIRRENIFKAHRTHFYQFLSNEKQWPHLSVSIVYCILQLLINSLVLILFDKGITGNGIAIIGLSLIHI